MSLTANRPTQPLTGPGVLQLEVLVLKLLAVDRLAPRAVPLCEVAPLAHEPRDDAVELAPLVAEPLLPRAQRAEILCAAHATHCSHHLGLCARKLDKKLHIHLFCHIRDFEIIILM